MKVDINPMTRVVNAYTMPPHMLEETVALNGQINMLYVVKALVTDTKNGQHYKLYRCGWDGTPNSDPNVSGGVPQGEAITGTANEIQAMALRLFSCLVHGGAIPDPFEYGELETKENDE